jgi:gamma-glutamylcyclotransferase (GGCT)/AIG2-like uncharacterized protein YtfP
VTPPRVFVYGTLQDETLVVRLIGRRLPWRPAVLPDHERRLDATIGYPVIHAAPGACVHGRVLDGVDAATLAAFDAYEGGEYRRQVVWVKTEGGGAVDAYVYVPAQDGAGAGPRYGRPAKRSILDVGRG